MSADLYFPGDNAHQVMQVQWDTTIEVIQKCIQIACDKVAFAEELLQNPESELGTLCHESTTFDKRALEGFYDQMAAAFRFSKYRWPLFHLEESREKIAADWQEYAATECAKLMDDPKFVRPFLNTVRHGFAAQAAESRDVMDCILRNRYWRMYSYCLPKPNPEE